MRCSRWRLGCLLATAASAAVEDAQWRPVTLLDGGRLSTTNGISRRLEEATEEAAAPPMFWATVGLVMIGLLTPGFVCRAVQVRYKSDEPEAQNANEAEADAEPEASEDVKDEKQEAAPYSNFDAYEAQEPPREEWSEALAEIEKEAAEEEKRAELLTMNWTSPEEGEIFVEQTGPKQDPPKFLHMMLRPEDAALAIHNLESRMSKDRQELGALQPYNDEKPKVPLGVALRQFSEIVYTEQGPRSEPPATDPVNDPAIVTEHIQQLDLSGLVCGSTCGTGTSCWLAAALCGSRYAQGARPSSPGRDGVARPPRALQP